MFQFICFAALKQPLVHLGCKMNIWMSVFLFSSQIPSAEEDFFETIGIKFLATSASKFSGGGYVFTCYQLFVCLFVCLFQQDYK